MSYPERVVFVIEKRAKGAEEWTTQDHFGWPDIAEEQAEYLALKYPSAEWRVIRYVPSEHKSNAPPDEHG